MVIILSQKIAKFLFSVDWTAVLLNIVKLFLATAVLSALLSVVYYLMGIYMVITMTAMIVIFAFMYVVLRKKKTENERRR